MIFAEGYLFGNIKKCREQNSFAKHGNIFVCSFLCIGDDEDYNSDSSGDSEYSQAALATVSPFSSISATYPSIGGFTNYLLASTVH